MNPVTKISFETTIDVTRTIEHIAINERLVCVRVNEKRALANPTKLINQKRFSAALFSNTTEMILTLANLKNFLAGNLYKAERLHPVSAAHLEDARTKGYVRAIEMHANELGNEPSLCFDRLQAGETLRMVRLDYASHMLFDDEGNVLPTGLYYDYMHGNMRNGAYDLKKVVAVLNTLSDVYVGNEKELCVEPVPYYNVSPGCTTCVSFVYGPTQEQMTALWKKAQSMDAVYPSTVLHKAVFDLDLLGFRATGAALGDAYYGESRDKDTDEDDNDD